ncbi:hypothetical protein BHE74_00037293 [Ensete ventricosum]|nr:hypothetical protein BHE74_00037293 [Ensete ventricosum]
MGILNYPKDTNGRISFYPRLRHRGRPTTRSLSSLPFESSSSKRTLWDKACERTSTSLRSRRPRHICRPSYIKKMLSVITT